MSQPTVSLSLKRLEEEYGVELIHRDRSHNTLSVTKAGAQLATHALSILSELTQTQKDLEALQETTVRLGLPPIIGNYYFPQFIPTLVQTGTMDTCAPLRGDRATCSSVCARVSWTWPYSAASAPWQPKTCR
ncbi:LysR family transcriptional regulator [Lacticaseibacillus thailandensis]|uniref:LysR family transcriptional regulator n=1 Tax=Lacticaseibacillus thailandensis TaxID=381741 RepID=UPI0009EB093F